MKWQIRLRDVGRRVADRPVPSKITDLAPKVIDRAAAIGDTQSTFAPGRSETSVVTLRAGSVAVSVPSEETARLPDCSSASASDGVVPFDVGDTLHEMRLRMKEFLADTDFQAGENGRAQLAVHQWLVTLSALLAPD